MYNVQDVAKDIGITKQAVIQITKRALKKVWANAEKNYPEMDAFDRMSMLAIMFNASESDEDYEEFFSLFPKNIQKEVAQLGKKLL